MHIVYSTITEDTAYVSYVPGPATQGSARINKKVVIKGGANKAPLAGQLITPLGVPTIVNDEVMTFLESNEAFNRHRDRGFIRVDKGSKPKDADAVAKAGMTSCDLSAPMTRNNLVQLCAGQGADLSNIKAVVQPTESSKARMK